MDMDDCTPHIDDEETPSTSSVPSSLSSFDESTTSFADTYRNSETSDSSLELSEEAKKNIFPVMQLPAEIRAKILNMQNQRSVPILRLVCRQWKEEIDQFYEFILNIYDTTTNLSHIKNFRCRECTIWKLTQKLSSPPHLFAHPAYLKVIKIYGPTSAENLQNLISASTNLEHLTLTRRANYPWFLNLEDTPSLNNLLELKYLRLNSEEHILLSSHPARNDAFQLKRPPMMDCYFPKLKHFEILKRFAIWQYSHYVTCILQFVARHAKTLTNIEMDLIPLSCVAILDDHEDSDSSEEEYDDPNAVVERDRHRRSPRMNRNGVTSISPDAIQLNELCKLRLQKFCVTTKGSDRDIYIWKCILEKQTELRELRFDWLCRDPRAEIRARVTGFPWIHFQAPVEQCASTLVHVELASLSMFAKDFPSSSRNISSRVIPFDLGIFRHCHRLKSLILRCRENHAKLQPNELAQLNPDVDLAIVEGNQNNNNNLINNHNNGRVAVAVAPLLPLPQGAIALAGQEGQGQADGEGGEEVLLMVNGAELPDCLEQLEIFRFPMLTSDIESMVGRLGNIRKLFLHECGKSGDFGVSSNIIRQMANLTSLKFLEVIGFNDSTGERKRELEEVFQAIGIPYEGQDTWLEFSDGSSSAYESLKILLH